MEKLKRVADLRGNGPTDRRCTATTKHGPNAGKRCGGRPIRGGTVCMKHGGAAPQVRAKAERQLQAARNELMEILLGIARNAVHPDQFRALTWALERAGFRAGVELSVAVRPWQQLLNRWIASENPNAEDDDDEDDEDDEDDDPRELPAAEPKEIEPMRLRAQKASPRPQRRAEERVIEGEVAEYAEGDFPRHPSSGELLALPPAETEFSRSATPAVEPGDEDLPRYLADPTRRRRGSGLR
jgi:hypothetical protein